MTNQEMIEKLTKAVGGTAYGDELIAEAKKNIAEGPHKYGQTEKDLLDDRKGLIAGWIAKHDREGKLAEVPSEEEKYTIILKALKAIEE